MFAAEQELAGVDHFVAAEGKELGARQTSSPKLRVERVGLSLFVQMTYIIHGRGVREVSMCQDVEEM